MRALGFWAPQRVKRICYLAMVRSIIEYASIIWSPRFKYLITSIEALQRRATNYILANPRRPNPNHLNYKERLTKLNMLPLSYRREIADIVFFLKTWNSNSRHGIRQIYQLYR